MTRLIKIGLAVLIGAAGFDAVSAKSASDGYVTGFVTLNSGIVFFTQSGTISGSTISCDNGGITNRWGFDATTPTGQALLSLLMTAKNTHEVIKITGSGSCSSGSSSEMPGIIVTDDAQ